MEEGNSSFYKSRLSKMILQVLLLLGFLWLLMVVVVVDTRKTSSKVMMMERLSPQSTGSRRPEVITAGQRYSNRRLERLKFVSKRRVPNGPDPIHNRRAGNSNQPPGRSQGVGKAAIKGRRQ